VATSPPYVKQLLRNAGRGILSVQRLGRLRAKDVKRIGSAVTLKATDREKTGRKYKKANARQSLEQIENCVGVCVLRGGLRDSSEALVIVIRLCVKLKLSSLL